MNPKKKTTNFCIDCGMEAPALAQRCAACMTKLGAREPGPITQSLSELPPAYVESKTWLVVLDGFPHFTVKADLVYVSQAGALAFERGGKIVAFYAPRLWLRCELQEPKP